MNVNLRGIACTCLAVALACAIAPVTASGAAKAPGKSRAEVPATAEAKRARPAAGDEATRGRPRVAPRMLDDIRIEGEIPVPQVLFITARDQRRFLEFQHHRYQVTSLELGRATPVLTRLVLTTPSPDKAKQEDPR